MVRHRIVSVGILLLLAALLLNACSDDPTTPETTTIATITTPAPGDTVDGLQRVLMEGVGTTSAGQTITPVNMSWYLRVGTEDSLLGTGFSQNRFLAPGDQTIVLEVQESINLSATTSVTFFVEPPDNYPPVPRIIEPFNGEDFLPAHVVTVLTGAAVDVEDGVLPDEALSWRSSIDGDLGTGMSLDANLSPGDHALILTATDSEGLASRDTINVTLRGRPAEPVIDGDFFFQANEFNDLCAEKEIVWLIGNCFVDVHEDTDQADMTIYDMSGTFTCDLDNLCFLSGNEANGNIRVWTEADDGLGGTLRIEISLTVTDGNAGEGIAEMTGLVRGIELPDGGPPCIYRSRIRAVASQD